MKGQRCRTKGSKKPPVKQKLVQAGSSSRFTRQKSSLAKAESSVFLTIFDDKEGFANASELQTDIDFDQMKGECEVLKERERAMDKDCEELKAKCEAAMEEFYKNRVVNVLRQKITSRLDEVKEHKASMDRMLLESQKWSSYQENLGPLELKVATLEAKKGKLEAVEALLRQEIKAVKYDRAEVVSKVIPYVSMELVHSDEMAMLVGKLVSFAVFYGRPTYKKEHMKAGNGLVAVTFPFLLEVAVDLFASVTTLLSKNPKSLRRLTLTKTHAPVSSAPSQKVTPSSAPTLKPMPHPFVVGRPPCGGDLVPWVGCTL
ncbi:hypothetical protein Tco_0815987 [Tanacetum coccineum]